MQSSRLLQFRCKNRVIRSYLGIVLRDSEHRTRASNMRIIAVSFPRSASVI